MSYNGVGLATARGSGTSGHVQRNLAALPKTKHTLHKKGAAPPTVVGSEAHSEKLAEHKRRRAVEVRVEEERARLEDAGDMGDDAIDARCAALRVRLTEGMGSGWGKKAPPASEPGRKRSRDVPSQPKERADFYVPKKRKA